MREAPTKRIRKHWKSHMIIESEKFIVHPKVGYRTLLLHVYEFKVFHRFNRAIQSVQDSARKHTRINYHNHLYSDFANLYLAPTHFSYTLTKKARYPVHCFSFSTLAELDSLFRPCDFDIWRISSHNQNKCANKMYFWFQFRFDVVFWIVLWGSFHFAHLKWKFLIKYSLNRRRLFELRFVFFPLISFIYLFAFWQMA